MSVLKNLLISIGIFSFLIMATDWLVVCEAPHLDNDSALSNFIGMYRNLGIAIASIENYASAALLISIVGIILTQALSKKAH